MFIGLAQCAFVHRGSSVTGNKVSGNITVLAEGLTSRGLNFVSIQYRLQRDGPAIAAEFQPLRDDFSSLAINFEPTRLDAAVAASADTVQAMRWLENNAGNHCVDLDRLALWGSSAGAYTDLQVGYGLNQYGIAQPEPKVVLDFWGGLFRDLALEQTGARFIPHGEVEPTVPIYEANELSSQAILQNFDHSYYSVLDGGRGFTGTNFFDLKLDGTAMIDVTATFIEAHIATGSAIYENRAANR